MIKFINEIKNNYEGQVVFITYCLVGLASALIDVGGLKVLSEFYHVADLYAITIAYIMGMLCNYALHNILTFNVKMSKRSFVRYLIVVVFNYILSLLLISLLQITGISLILSKVITLPVISITGFILSKKWIYAK